MTKVIYNSYWELIDLIQKIYKPFFFIHTDLVVMVKIIKISHTGNESSSMLLSFSGIV